MSPYKYKSITKSFNFIVLFLNLWREREKWTQIQVKKVPGSETIVNPTGFLTVNIKGAKVTKKLAEDGSRLHFCTNIVADSGLKHGVTRK